MIFRKHSLRKHGKVFPYAAADATVSYAATAAPTPDENIENLSIHYYHVDILLVRRLVSSHSFSSPGPYSIILNEGIF